MLIRGRKERKEERGIISSPVRAQARKGESQCSVAEPTRPSTAFFLLDYSSSLRGQRLLRLDHATYVHFRSVCPVLFVDEPLWPADAADCLLVTRDRAEEGRFPAIWGRQPPKELDAGWLAGLVRDLHVHGRDHV